MYGFIFTIVPFAIPSNVAIAIVLFGLAYAMLSLVIQRRLSNPAKTRELQARIQALTSELNQMAKRNEDITEKQRELMPLMGESMRLQMKSMLVILPMFYAVYYGALPYIFGPLAFGGAVNLVVTSLNYTGLFFVTVLLSSLTMSFSMLAYDKRKAKVVATPSTSGGQ